MRQMETRMEANSETELERKKRFAIELLKDPNDPFKAALRVFGQDTGMALRASSTWPTDVDVIKFTEEAVGELGDLHFLPSKADLAREAWTLATSANVPVDDRLKAMRLYGDVRGFIEKQGTIINNNVLTNNKVMLVKDHGSTDNWEERLIEQQAKLIDDANAPRTV